MSKITIDQEKKVRSQMTSTDTNQMQNERGEWVPSIPLPLFGLRKRCGCGEKFWTELRYYEHYAFWHIVAGRKPL